MNIRSKEDPMFINNSAAEDHINGMKSLFKSQLYIHNPIAQQNQTIARFNIIVSNL